MRRRNCRAPVVQPKVEPETGNDAKQKETPKGETAAVSAEQPQQKIAESSTSTGVKTEQPPEPTAETPAGLRAALEGYTLNCEVPEHLPTEFLNRIFSGSRKKRNFMIWVPNSNPDHPRIRVNAKFDAWNTYVKVPDDLTWHRKTTLVQWRDGDEEWELRENRVPAQDYDSFGYSPARTLIFLLPPRYSADRNAAPVAYKAVQNAPDVRGGKTTVMSKNECKLFYESSKHETHKDIIMWKILGKAISFVGLFF